MPRLEEDAARRLFASVPVARLATVDAGGAPHLVATTFAVDGDLIYLAVDHKPKRTRALRRLANIAAEPRVALLADHYEDDWTRLWWVRADGEARVISDPAGQAAPVDRLVARYAQYRAQRPEGPVIVVTVRRWTGWIYGDSAPRSST
jgi:PPOX class probable F420-dependent enzyme